MIRRHLESTRQDYFEQGQHKVQTVSYIPKRGRVRKEPSLKCPACKTDAKLQRSNYETHRAYRYYDCPNCNRRFSTVERIQNSGKGVTDGRSEQVLNFVENPVEGPEAVQLHFSYPEDDVGSADRCD